MSAWPTVKARLRAVIAGLPAAAGWEVYAGEPVTKDAPLKFVTVGWALEVDEVGGFEQQRDESGFFHTESGTVVCEFVAWSGDPSEQTATETAAFALFGALEASVLSDQTLAALAPASTLTLSATVRQLQTTAAASTRLLVTASYFARL